MKPVDIHNEITVKVLENVEEIKKQLITAGLKEVTSYYMLDYYFIPCHLEIEKMTNREVLRHAILIREITYLGQEKMQYIVFKKKEIKENGEIEKQEIVNCSIYETEEAKKLLEALEYKEIMKIEEKGLTWEKEGFQLVIKDVVGGNTLIEVETNECERYNTTEKIQQKLLELNLKIDKSDFFVKKAEIELEKRRKHEGK